MTPDSREGGRPGGGFIRMARAEALALATLVLFSALCFLPVWRRLEVAGMVLFGWWMAALMLLSPVLMLVLFLRRRRR
jgi:hypothetical protein